MAIRLVNDSVLLSVRPDWIDGAEISLQWQTGIAPAQRGNEDRASLRALPQAQLAWNVVTDSPEEGAELENKIRAALRSGQACAPCYARPTYVQSVGNGSVLTIEATQWPWAAGDYLFAVGPDGITHVAQIYSVVGTRLTIYTVLPAVNAIWPLVFGRLEVEKPEQETPDTLALGCRLFIPQWKLPTASAAPTIYAGSPLVPAVVATDWSDSVERSFNYNPAIQQIGFGAETFETEQSYVAHGVVLTAELVNDGAISDVEAFVGSLGGRRGNFWLPTHERAMLISGSQSASSFFIRAQGLADSWNSQPAQALYFHKQGFAPMIGRISAVAAAGGVAELVTLDAALPVAVDATWDVYRLRLMRLADDELKESYEADGLCTIRVSAIEVPLEYFTALVAVKPAYLYLFSAQLDVPVQWLLTSHAQPITTGGNTFNPETISHGDIKRTMESTDESVTLTTQFSVGNPLAQFLPFPPGFRMGVTILRYDLGSPDAAAVVEFTGYVRAPKLIGRKIEAKVQCPIDFLDSKVPTFYIGFSCNARLYRPGCNLNEADWRTAAQIAALGGVGVALAANPGKPTNYYAGGHLTVGAGVNTERRTIMRSSGASLVLNYPLLKAAVGAAVGIYPGCDHNPDDCQGTFNNWVNYRGHPKVPQKNPTLNAIDVSGSGGKK